MKLGRSQSSTPSGLAVYLNESWNYFHITADGVTPCDPAELTAGPVFRIWDRDVCIAARNLRGAKLRQRVNTEVQAQPMMLRQSGFVYATPYESVMQASHRVVPMTLAIKQVQKTLQMSQPCLIGLQLGADATALSVAWAIGPTGAIGPPSVTPGHDEIDRVQVAQGAAEAIGLSDQTLEDTRWLDVAECLELLQKASLPSYPLPNEWYGIPKSRWTTWGAGLAAVYAVLACADWGLAWHSGQALVAAKRRTTHAHPVTPRIEKLDRTHADAIARMEGVHIAPGLTAAHALWRPATTVALSLTQQGISARHPAGHTHGKIVVTINRTTHEPLNQSSQLKHVGPSALGIHNALASKPPAGWKLTSIQMDSGGRIAKVIYANH